jgi:CHAT domain-containing protein
MGRSAAGDWLLVQPMKETIETLIGKDERELCSFVREAECGLIEELFAELWKNIRIGNLYGGQPRSRASLDGVMLARLGLTLAEHSNDVRLTAEAWSMMAYTLNANEDYAESLPFYRKSIEAFERLGDERRAARTRLGFMGALSMTGQHDEAVRAGLEADEWFQENRDIAGRARLRLNLGGIYQRLDDHDRAIQYISDAVETFTRLDDQQALAQSYVNLGNSLAALTRFAEAEDAYTLSEEITQQLGFNDLLIQARYNKAYVHLLRGRYSQALASYTKLRKIFTEHESLRHSALCSLDESEIYIQLNLPQEAASYGDRAIQSFRGLGMRYEQAKATAFFGIALTQNRQFGDALQAFRSAQALFAEEGNTYWVALLDLYTAEVLFSLGRYWEADSVAKSAEREFEKLGKISNRAINMVLLARIAMELRRFDDSEFFANAILDLTREHKMPLFAFPCYALCAEIAEGTGNLEKAKELYQLAARESENQHTHLRHDELGIVFFKRKREVYESLARISLLSSRGDVDEAFMYCERAKSTELIDLLAHHVPSVRGQADQRLLERVNRIRDELNGSYLRSRLEVSDISLIPETARIEMKENELVRMLREMSDIDPEYVSLQSVSVLGLPAIQSQLPPGTQVLQFFTIEEEVIAFILSRDSIEVVRHLLPVNRANFLLTRLRIQLERFEKRSRTNNDDLGLAEITSTLHNLYQQLFASLEAHITGSRLIIVPDRLLYSIPFHAFFDGQSYLGDRFEISYAPSCSVLKHNLERAPVASEEAVFLLPQNGVRAWPFCSSRVFTGEDATRERFMNEAAHAHCLHLETDIVYRPNRPLFSCFKLADEWVTALDLFSTLCECNVATLIGTQAGNNPASSGEDLQALARAFLYAGARSLLLGLWNTHAEPASLLARYFYEQWLSGQPKTAALKTAVQRLRKDFPHPFHWAPFALFGQP